MARSTNDSINEDAESFECQCGAWTAVARRRCEGSRSDIGAGAWPLASTSVSLCGERTHDYARAASRRAVSRRDLQDSARRSYAIAGLRGQQRFVIERDCHRRFEKTLDLNSSTLPTWLSDVLSLPQFVWNSLSIVRFRSSCSKCTDCWLRIALAR